METSDEAKLTLETIQTFIRNNQDIDVSRFLRDIVRNYLRQEQEINKITTFFSKIYDELYYDIIIKKIKVRRNVSRTLESLACPRYSRTDTQWTILIKKILRKK